MSGFLMTRLTKILKLPNVTAYIVAGILVGPFCLKAVPQNVIDGSAFVSDIALGKEVRTKTWTGRQSFEGSMYTEKEKEKALGLYDKTKSITEVIRRLGYPSRQAMYTWIANRNKPWRKRKSFRGINTAEHPRHPSAELRQYRKAIGLILTYFSQSLRMSSKVCKLFCLKLNFHTSALRVGT